MHIYVWSEKVSFTPEQLLIGTGWHAVEREGGTYIRWTGPDPVATIHLAPRRDHPNRINLTLHAVADEEVLGQLSLEADGMPLPVTLGIGRNPAHITAILPADSGKAINQPTILALKIPRTLTASQVLNDPNDRRNLGIALERINIFPQARPLFTAQKYADPIPFDGINYLLHNPGVRDAVLHGLHSSAYDYFIKHNRKNEQTAFTLGEHFDERPGDIYDILQDDIRQESAKQEKRYQEEIKLLKKMLYRQGDVVRELQAASVRKK